MAIYLLRWILIVIMGVIIIKLLVIILMRVTCKKSVSLWQTSGPVNNQRLGFTNTSTSVRKTVGFYLHNHDFRNNRRRTLRDMRDSHMPDRDGMLDRSGKQDRADGTSVAVAAAVVAEN